MKLTFHGAAGEVTGSQHLLETENLRILFDCGLFQGRRSDTYKKNSRFHCDPKNLDAVILSHSHIDHSGNLPGLYRAGFRGPVYCTEATAELTAIMLKDSAHIQSEDARYLNRHLKKGHPPTEPLYNDDDVKELTRLFEPLEYGKWLEFSPEMRLRFSDAGHILGSAISEVHIEDKGETKRVVFTGDLGRRGLPLLRDPQPIPGCDVLITESTYGNRVHPPATDIKQALKRIVLETIQNEGRIIIPAFSLGRTQRLLYFLNELIEKKEIPLIPIFVDSPLATRLTTVYRKNHHILNEESKKLLRIDDDLFDFPGLTYVQSQQESIALNRKQPNPFLVISASGMCESGRVRHHLKHAIGKENSTIMMIGYQAHHTLGRKIIEHDKQVKIFDRIIPVKARVEKLNGLSAHADVNDFKWWFEKMASDGGIGQAFLVHGEAQSAKDLAVILDDCCDHPPIIPSLHESFEI
jgi:metallo-beta-lactamase family protein